MFEKDESMGRGSRRIRTRKGSAALDMPAAQHVGGREEVVGGDDELGDPKESRSRQ